MIYRSILSFPFLLLLSGIVSAQINTNPTPTPRPGSRQASLPGVASDSANFDRLRSVEMKIPKERTHPLLDPKKGIYRRPGKDEVSALVIDELVSSKYGEFLKGDDTGIVKLNAESSCLSAEDVIVASEACSSYKFPGAGAAYSFRTESYRLPRLADLILFDDVFRTGGVYQHTILTEIGDIPIEEVTLQTRGFKFLVDLKPSIDGDEYLKFEKLIANGIDADGFPYRKGYPVNQNSTFALRSIAYRGKFIRAIEGIQYDELDFDKRRDVIIAFRVVDRDAKGHLTIVWKRLRDIESPTLKVKK